MMKNNNLIWIYLTVSILIFSCSNNSDKKAVDADSAATSEKITQLSKNYGGTYAFGENIEKGAIGTIKIYPLVGDTVLFYLDVNRGAPSYNMGTLAGKMFIENQVGTYTNGAENNAGACSLQFRFAKESVEVIPAENNDCGFGGNVSVAQVYKLVDRQIPTFYIKGDGDTVLFKDLKGQ